MAELADAHGWGPCVSRRGGSNPFIRTKTKASACAGAFFVFIKNKSVYKVFIRIYFYIFKKISGKILKTHNDWWGSFLFEIWFRYFINTTLLVDIHILYAQKWAAPFPCSKTKSKMYACARQCEKEICDFVFEHWEGISHSWTHAVITTRCYCLSNSQLFVEFK